MKEDFKKKGEENKSSSSPESHLRDEGGKERKTLFNPDKIYRELEECQKQRDEYLAGWQRAKADFINNKKEEAERMEGIMKYIGEEMVLMLIPVIDNFDLVEKNLSEEDKKNDKIKGILQIKSQIQEILKINSVEEINTKEAKFDPNFHEAIEQVESDKESGTILEELQKGYLINGKVIRPSKVKVAK